MVTLMYIREALVALLAINVSDLLFLKIKLIQTTCFVKAIKFGESPVASQDWEAHSSKL